MTTAGRTKDGLSFGPFHLVASERLLTKAGAPVELGSRALDILTVLISTPNEIVSKKDLMSRVWPDVLVEEGSLRFHVASLRKALGDGKNGARYITTLPGRGYCFVAPVSQPNTQRDVPVVAVNFPHANLPSRLSRMVGRDDDVLKLSAQLSASRFVTIVGTGGVGKTTVAIAVGNHLIEAFAGAVLFVDLGMISDPGLVTTAAASLLGLSIHSDDATPNLIAYLRNKRILLIFDTCEHLVEAVATLAASIIEAAPQVHILATSREALRVESEHIYRLDALACPPDDPGLTAAVVQTFPATQLFVERAAASGARAGVSDAEAAIVAGICRKLDGVALAIELAARHVESYGLQQTAALLDQRLTLLWLGSRTAPPRQKTLQAMLDWSFGLLAEPERVVLRRLAVFVGHFTLDAALEVVTNATLDRSAVFSAIDSLVAKSIVATRPLGAMVRYRLLDTTRVYVVEIEIDDAEATDLAVRHAAYYRRWLEQTWIEWSGLATGEERIPHFAAVNNARAALEWCFGADGNSDIGVGLAAAAAPVFLAMSLLPECHRWSKRAILALDDTALGGLDEMHLQAALGVSLMFTRGGRETARVALERSFAIAEKRGDALDQVRLLGPLNMFHLRTGNFAAALQCARRCYIDMLISRAESHSLAPYLLVGRGFKSEVAIRHGDARGGVESLQSSLQKLHAAPYELLTTELNLLLAGGLSAIGQVDEAISLIDESLGRVEASGNFLYIPELLRAKGKLLASMPQPSAHEAERCFVQSLELSRRQGARGWELRSATDVAALWASQERSDDAHALLRPVFEQFVEGSNSADLKAAERLLEVLR